MKVYPDRIGDGAFVAYKSETEAKALHRGALEFEGTGASARV